VVKAHLNCGVRAYSKDTITACGHNLIAICGLGAGAAMKAAMIKFNIPGKVKVIGTPAEEGGGGKIMLIRRGIFESLDTCSMSHPSGDLAPESKLDGTCTIGGPGSLARSSITAEFFGKGAHAGVSDVCGRSKVQS
jgi:metal-dependent amidase/aminoacylase/carboxypeptidase family protein